MKFVRAQKCLLALALVLCMVTTVSAAARPVLYLDGRELPASAYIDENDRTQAELPVAQAMGLTVTDQGDTVLFERDGKSIAVSVGSNQMGGTTMDTNVRKGYIPLRFLAEAFGFTVTWNSSSGNVELSSPADLTRSTQYGKVGGTTLNDALVWYGIPYAAPPEGELRWSASVDPVPWAGVKDCSSAGNIAVQYSAKTVKGSEDCLNLDVYAPKNAEKLPVLVYIHAGNNQTGSGSEINASEVVVKSDCVYVGINYRLGLLGFNCLPALLTEENATGNFALLDMAKALDWVKANIASFGGDPGNITISGFSAGGRDVMTMLVSPVFTGKFDKAIVYSGEMTIADQDASASQIAYAMAPLAVEDGMAADEAAAKAWLLTDGADVREYLYSLTAERLAPMMASAQIRMSGFPHLYGDDVVLPSAGFSSETYNSVPLIMLTGTTEFSRYNSGGYLNSEEYTALDEETKAAAAEFSKRYGSDMYRIFNAQCSAETMFEHYDSDIYLCQVNYDKTTMGSFHGIFIPMLTSDIQGFASFGDFNAVGYTGMAKKFNAYLRSFLHTGNPNGEGTDTLWSAWSDQNKQSMIFDGDDNGGIAEMRDVSSSYSEIIGAMEKDSSVSEEIKAELIRTVLNGRWFSEAQDKHFNNASLWH